MSVKRRVEKLEQRSDSGLKIEIPKAEPDIFGPLRDESWRAGKVSWEGGKLEVTRDSCEAFDEFRGRVEAEALSVARKHSPKTLFLPLGATYV